MRAPTSCARADGRQVEVVELGHAVAQVRGHRVDDRLVAEQQLARTDRGHDEGAGAGDAGQGVVVRERAVLDAVDARLDRVEDALERVGVRGDGLEAVVGHLHGSPQLVEPVLDGPGVLGLRREHGAGRHHLDEVGAVRELAPDRPPHLVRPIGHLVHPRVVRDRGGGDGQEAAREEEPRPGDLSAVDGLPDGHLDVVPAADVPGRGDARGQGPPCRRRGEQRDGSVGAGGRAGRVRLIGGLGEVDVAVDQPGQQPAAVEVDDGVVGRGRGPGHDGGDPLTVDADVGAHEPLAVGVQHHGAREPAHGSLPCDRSVDQSID